LFPFGGGGGGGGEGVVVGERLGPFVVFFFSGKGGVPDTPKKKKVPPPCGKGKKGKETQKSLPGSIVLTIFCGEPRGSRLSKTALDARRERERKRKVASYVQKDASHPFL